MFTGLVEDTADVITASAGRDGVRRFVFRPSAIDVTELILGESVAIDGCCLTVVEIDANGFAMEATEETLTKTTLGARKPGDRVNVERSLRFGDRLGGHLVTGHVDMTGSVLRWAREGDTVVATFGHDASHAGHFVEKGSVAVDGVSLTVNQVTDGSFSVVLIPHTLAVTTLGQRKVGDAVNLETDLLGKYVISALTRRGVASAGSKITEQFLDEHGFS